MKKSLITSLLLIVLINSVFAQPQQDINLKNIEVEGNTLTNSDVIIFTSGLKEGNIIKAGDFSRGVQQLWKSGLFNDIQIYVKEESIEGISIKIVVAEAPVLGEIIIIGDKKVSKTKIEESIGLRTGQRIPEFQIESGKSKVLDLYSEEGFLLATVDVSIEYVKEDSTAVNKKRSANTRNLKFNINEGHKVKIDAINFVGNESVSDRRLRRALKDTKQQRWYFFWRSSFDENKYKDDQEKLKAFYQKHGYRDAIIVTDSTSYSSDKRKMYIWLTVNEGPKYYYCNFSWDGNELYTDKQLNSALGISNGDA